MVLLPSEKARLVLGYLREQECYQAYKEFLIKSPHLKELRGMIRRGIQPHEYEWKLRGLSNILDDYSSIECSICALQINCDTLKQFREASSVVKKVQWLIEFVREHLAVSHSSLKSNCSTSEGRGFRDLSKMTQLQKNTRNTIKSKESQNLLNSSMIVKNGIPIISNIPESVLSDESSDICSISFSPTRYNKTVIENENDKRINNQTSSFLESCKKGKMKNELKKDINKSKNENKINTTTDDGVDVTLISETLLERTDIHEKIAENINKLYLSSKAKNDDKTGTISESGALEQINEKGSGTDTDLETHLNNVIRDIVNATEKDHAFDELLDELIVKAAEDPPCSTSDDTSPGRPTTSTPEQARGKTKSVILDTSTSPVKNISEINKSFGKNNEVEKNSDQKDDSIKNRLRSRSKQQNDEQSSNCNKSNLETTSMEVDKTPQKSSKHIDLLAMAINDADVSGSLRKLTTSTNKNENKIVILSNEVVHRNLSDFNFTKTDSNSILQNKIGNVPVNNENSLPFNTHYILPTVNGNNMFLNTNMPQYLVTANNGDDDQNKVFLINTAPLNLPVQNNANSEMSDVLTMPTILVLPQAAPAPSVINDNSSIGYQPLPITKKPKAVILPQPEQCKVQKQIDSNDVIVISDHSESVQNILPKLTINVNEINKALPKKLKNISEKPLINNIPKTDKGCIEIRHEKSHEKEISASKVIDLVKDDTPDLSTMQIKERSSLSTPRRRKSHVRVLDFNTPPKMNCSRKAITSPKSAYMRKSPKTAQKILKSSNRGKEPIRSALFRSPKSKITYISENIDKSNNKSSTKKNKRFESPAIKLNGGWDEVQGLGLIVGDKNKEVVKESNYLSQTSQKITRNSQCDQKDVTKEPKDVVKEPNYLSQSSQKITQKSQGEPDQQQVISKGININNENACMKVMDAVDDNSVDVPVKNEEKCDDFNSMTGKIKTKPCMMQKNKWDSDLRALLQTTSTTARCTRLMSKNTNKNNKESNKHHLSCSSQVKENNDTGKNKKIYQESAMIDHIKQMSDAHSDLVSDVKESLQNINIKTIESNININDATISDHADRNTNRVITEKITFSDTIEKNGLKNENVEIMKKDRNKNEKISKKLKEKECFSTVDESNKMYEHNQKNETINHKSESISNNVPKNNNICEKEKEEKNIECEYGKKLKDKEKKNKTEEFKENATDINKENLNIESDIIRGCDNNSSENHLKKKNKIIDVPINVDDGSAVFMATDNVLNIKPSDKNHDHSNSLKNQPQGFINFEDMDNSRQRCDLKHISNDQNSSDVILLLETPFKLEEGMLPKTPRFLQASQIEDTPLTKIKRNTDSNSLAKCGIPTPNFPLTPSASASSTPDIKNLENAQKDASEKSVLNSYYKPDQSANINIHNEKQIFNSFQKIQTDQIKTSLDNCSEDGNKNEDMDVSSNTSSSSSSSSSSESDSYSSSNSSSSSDDSSFNSSKEINLDASKISELNTSRVSLNNKEKLMQKSPAKKIIDAVIPCKSTEFDEVPKVSEMKNIYTANVKLLQELDAKRRRILEKVKADLAMKPSKSLPKNKIKNMADTMKRRNNIPVAKPKIKTIKTNISRNTDGKFLSKEKIEETNSKWTTKNKNRRKSDSPRKRCLPEVEPKAPDIEILQKNDKFFGKQLDDNLDTSFPKLHLSDDESECGNYDIPQKGQENLKEPINESIAENVDDNKISDCSSELQKVEMPKDIPPVNKDNYKMNENDHSDDDNESSFEFNIQDCNNIEYCTENENVRSKDKINDGFDAVNFRIYVGEQGVLKIPPLVSLLDIPPSLTEKLQKKSNVPAQRETNPNKKKKRKTPLHILFETTVQDKNDLKQNSTQENTVSRTPCANLYVDSPKGKYEHKRDSKKHIKHTESKRSGHEDKINVCKKENSKERVHENKSLQSTSSFKDEKGSKRKRNDEPDIFLNKKNKPCNPQELIKNVDLDKLLDVIHGKK